MGMITLSAHFDGEQIRLDEPYDLQPNTRLTVTVLPEHEDDDRTYWTQFALQNLSAAYADDEEEYPLDLIKEPNPDYEGR